jgi:hypothetical protein
MWTAKIKSVLKSAGRIAVTVTYTSATESFDEEYSSVSKVDMTWLQSQVRNRIEAITAAYAFADSLTSNQAIDVTPAAAPTQAELELSAWQKDYTRWLAVQRAIDTGVLTGAETKVVELKDKVKAGFKPAYLAVM